MAISRLSRHLQDVLEDEKMFVLEEKKLLRWRRLQDILAIKKSLLGNLINLFKDFLSCADMKPTSSAKCNGSNIFLPALL